MKELESLQEILRGSKTTFVLGRGDMMEQVEQYLAEHSDRRVLELKDFLRIASVSAVSSARPEMRRGAQFVCDQLTDAGLEAEVVETAGHPLVFGSWLGAGDAPTVLVYGHYDVQPPDPLKDWVTPPFDVLPSVN